MDYATILESVAKTGRLVVTDPSHRTCRPARPAEIAATVAEDGFWSLQAPIVRVTTPDTHIPFSPPLEAQLYPKRGADRGRSPADAELAAPMATEVRLPQVGTGMTDCTVLEWIKGVGDSVRQGECIAEVEAAKTTVEIEAPAPCVLAEILTPAGPWSRSGRSWR